MRLRCFCFVSLVTLSSVLLGAQDTVPAADQLLAESEKLRLAGKSAEAVEVARRALAMAEQALGPNHPSVATALNAIGTIQFFAAGYAEAERAFVRALSIREAAFEGPNSLVAQSLNNLAQVYLARGNLKAAEPLLQRALELQERLHGATHQDVAGALNNLAGFYLTLGDYSRSQALFERALQIRQTVSGPDNLLVGQALNNLGLVLQEKGDLPAATQVFERASAMREKHKAPPQDLARTLNNLASVYQESGELDRAEPLYRRALDLYETSVGARHPLFGQTLSNLAVLLFLKGDHTAAEPLYRRALEVREAALGPNHTDVAVTLSAISVFYGVLGRASEGLELQARALDIVERNLQSTLEIGSESQKMRYLQTFADSVDITLSLRSQLDPHNSAASRLAGTVLLRRKGRILDALMRTTEALRRSAGPEQRALLDELSEARAMFARAVLQGRKADIERYRAAVEGLESSLSSRTMPVVADVDVTLEQVQQAIPPDGIVLEFFKYRPFDPRERRRNRRFGLARYVVYVLERTGPGHWVELGDADPIDNAVEQLRAAIASAGASTDQLARRVHARVIQPIEELIGRKPHVFLSPDGGLNVLAFAALRDESGKYLVENHTLTYLTSVRDLLRRPAPAPADRRAAIFANPLFTRVQGTGPEPPSGYQFQPLIGAEDEARSIARILEGSRLFIGESATETSVKQLQAPLVLHLATHGFFTRAAVSSSASASRGLTPVATVPASPDDTLAPLLRSGLAFAGANGAGSGSDDGVLTALEAASLNLWGTRLVVLSACDTGLGEIHAGESVYGFRRALALAGAQTQIMTLWQVDDKATRDLMIDFYQQLKRGARTSEALRTVQLRMLKSRRWSHPRFWGAFVATGQTDSSIFPRR